MKDAEKSFGKWLRRQIEERGLTHEQFSLRVGVPVHTLRNWLYVRTADVSGRNRSRLAKALGMSRERFDEVITEKLTAPAVA